MTRAALAGATWRDPDRVEEWITELTPDKPVAVYCAYGFDIGRNVTKTLIERWNGTKWSPKNGALGSDAAANATVFDAVARTGFGIARAAV